MASHLLRKIWLQECVCVCVDVYIYIAFCHNSFFWVDFLFLVKFFFQVGGVVCYFVLVLVGVLNHVFGDSTPSFGIGIKPQIVTNFHFYGVPNMRSGFSQGWSWVAKQSLIVLIVLIIVSSFDEEQNINDVQFRK